MSASLILKFFYKIERKYRFVLYKNKSTVSYRTLNRAFTSYYNSGSLFIHIPKSAGISVHNSLYNVDSFGHLPIQEYYNFFGKSKVDRLFKFCFVRNPYDRLYSAFSYLKKGGRGEKIDLKYQTLLKDVSDFDDLVLNYLTKGKFKEIEHFRTQSYFLKNYNGKIEMDFVGKFETIERDFKLICDKLKIQNKVLPNININKSKEEITFTNKLKNRVYELYKEDFENFGYLK